MDTDTVNRVKAAAILWVIVVISAILVPFVQTPESIHVYILAAETGIVLFLLSKWREVMIRRAGDVIFWFYGGIMIWLFMSPTKAGLQWLPLLVIALFLVGGFYVVMNRDRLAPFIRVSNQ